MGIHDVDATLLIKRVAEELKKDANIKPPVWAPFVKTGMSRERAPVQNDWWFIRSAAILRKLFTLGPIGSQKLRNIFGGKKNNGYSPDHYYPGSGSIARKILQQLEKANFAKQVAKGFHKGRIIAPKGQQLLENVSSVIMKEQGLVLPAKPKEEVKIEEVKEEKPKKPRAPRKPRVKKVEAKAPEVANVQPQASS
jgi:small subunit ribosomal protein S19e